MTQQEIKKGQKWRFNDPSNAYNGIVVTVDYIQDGWLVRFSDAPFEGFGSGIEYFRQHYTLVE